MALIAAERVRQIEVEGYDWFHDQGHANELAIAGACYALDAGDPTWHDPDLELWPWGPEAWKPTPDDRVRELVKAGALIVAAIDALQEES